MNKPNTQNYIINTPELFERLTKYADKIQSDIFVLDVETDSKIIKKANIYGIGVCFNENKSFYIVWRDENHDEIWSPEMKKKIKDWILKQSKSKKLIGHNIIYDILVLENEEVYLTDYIYSDTILQKHTLDEEKPFSLKDVSVNLLGEWANEEQLDLKQEVLDRGGSWNSEQKDMYLASTKTLGKYCMMDVVLTYLLFIKFEQDLVKENLFDFFYEEEVMPLYKEVTIPMKRKGFPINIEHFEKLKKDISIEIEKLEKDIYESIIPYIKPFERELLDKEFPIKHKGKFPKIYAKEMGIPLPINKKTGKVTMAAKAIEKQKEQSQQYSDFYDWILGLNDDFKMEYEDVDLTQRVMFFEKNPDKKTVFNLNSNDHLIELFFNIWGLSPLSKTEKGKPQVDDKFLESQKGLPVIDKLIDLKKLNKLKSTYIDGILDRQINGILYTDMLGFGTTSGRYASRNPNLNNLPALKNSNTLVGKYTNAIRRGLIAGKGKKLVGSDFSSLEPHIAAYVTQDKGLMDIFINGEDFYSSIGVKQFNIKDATPYKDDSPDSFPVKYKSLRDTIKAYALSLFYGATPPRISQMIGKSIPECTKLVNGYFKTFPGVKKLINSSHYEACKKGYVTSIFGRKRHLPECKRLYNAYGMNLMDYKWARKNRLLKERSIFKNLLNNSVNFKIQSAAASCLNRAMIMMSREFTSKKLEAYILLPIHDEVLIQCEENIANKVLEIVKYCMENCVDLSPIKLKAEPIIGNSYADCK